MIVEYTCYKVPDDQSKALVDAYKQAKSVLDASPHCLRYELSQCNEEPTSYILRIEWDSLNGHLEGFRKSPQFASFFQAVRPFFNDIQEMRHYELTDVNGKKQ